MRSRLSTSFAALSIVGRWPTPNVILSEDFASRSAKQNRSRRIPTWQLSGGHWALSARLPHSVPLNPPLIQFTLKNPLHMNRRRMNRISIQLSNIHQMLHLGNCHLRRRRHHGIEIPRSLPIDQVARSIPLPRLHESKIGGEPALHDVQTPVKFAGLFSLGDDRSHTRRRIKRRNACAPCTNSLREGPLRN